MNNQLLLQIEALYNVIEEKENEYVILSKSYFDYNNTLQGKKTLIEELKGQVHELEELFLRQSLPKK